MNIVHQNKALIIDDSAVMLIALRRMCLGLGYTDHNITQAKSPKAALSLAKRENYQLIICDYNFNTRMNGRIFFEELKHKKIINHESVFIMVTGERTSRIAMSILELEPDEYYIKPFNPEFFVHRTRLAIKRKYALQKLNELAENKEYDQLDATCEEIEFEHPEFHLQVQKIKGELLAQQNKYAEALLVYQDVLNSKQVEWANLGAADSLMELGNMEASHNIITKLLNNGNDSVKVVTLAAKYDVYAGDIPNAIKHLSLASEIVPGNPDREYLVGILCLSQLDYKSAAARFYQYYELSIDTYRYSPKNMAGYISSCLMELDSIDKVLLFSDSHRTRDHQILIQERDGLERDILNHFESYLNDGVPVVLEGEPDKPFVEFYSELIGAHLALRKYKTKETIALLQKTYSNIDLLDLGELMYLYYLLAKLSFNKELAITKERIVYKIESPKSPIERAQLELLKSLIENTNKTSSIVNDALLDVSSKIKSGNQLSTLTDLIEAKKQDIFNKKINYYILKCLKDCWPKNYGKREVTDLIKHCFTICNELMTRDESEKSELSKLYYQALDATNK